MSEWGWWGEEGGKRLHVSRGKNQAVLFEVVESSGTAESTKTVASVTLASFRIKQLIDWLAPHPTD